MKTIIKGTVFGGYRTTGNFRRETDKSDKNRYFWESKCICGRVSWQSLNNLRKNKIGCVDCQRKYANSKRTTHGASKERYYKIYIAMLHRCYNTNNAYYHNYGGRGIKVCKEWKEDYYVFAKDIGVKPSPYHSLDRINNNGHYCKANIRWATRVEQMSNMRRNIIISYKGVKGTISNVARKLKINRGTLCYRIRKLQ